MKNVKKWIMSKKDFCNPLQYYHRIAEYIGLTYGINVEIAIQRIKDSMYFGYAICNDNDKCVGIESNFDRSCIFIGEMC